MQWSPVLEYGLGYGLALSVLFTAAVFAGAAMSRDFLLNDYPPAIQRRYGRPKSARGHRVATLFGVFIWAVCGLDRIHKPIAVPAVSAQVQLGRSVPHRAGARFQCVGAPS